MERIGKAFKKEILDSGKRFFLFQKLMLWIWIKQKKRYNVERMEMDDGFVLSENFFDTALAGKERNGSGIRQTRTRMSE